MLERIVALIDIVVEQNARYCEYNGHPVMQRYYLDKFALASQELKGELDKLASKAIKADIYKHDRERYAEALDLMAKCMVHTKDAPSWVSCRKDDVVLEFLAMVDAALAENQAQQAET